MATATAGLVGCGRAANPLTSVRFACDDAAALSHPTNTCPARGGPAWRELTSPHFVLRTDLPGECARAAMVEYEQIYAALRELQFRFEEEPPGRVALTVFARVRDFQQLTRDPTEAARFVSSTSPWVEPKLGILRWGDVAAMREAFTHELTHHFIRFYHSQVPIWVNEGLASFFGTMNVHAGWTELGASIRGPRSFGPTRWETGRFTLHTRDLPTVAELDAMTPEEFGGRRAGRDEAQLSFRNITAAWAVVHFLKTGPEKYRAAFEKYLGLAAQGKSHHGAWNTAFAGILEREIDRALRERLEDRRDPGLRTDYDPPPPPPITERAMSDGDVHLAWIKARSTGGMANPLPAHRIDVQEALLGEPNNPEALFMRAYLHLEGNRLEEAEADARRAMELRPTELRYAEGLALIYRDVVNDEGRAALGGSPRCPASAPDRAHGFAQRAQHLRVDRGAARTAGRRPRAVEALDSSRPRMLALLRHARGAALSEARHRGGHRRSAAGDEPHARRRAVARRRTTAQALPDGAAIEAGRERPRVEAATARPERLVGFATSPFSPCRSELPDQEDRGLSRRPAAQVREVSRLQPMSSGDTDDKARAAQLAVLRRLGPCGRVRLAAEMSEDARRIAFEAEQRRHPELSASEVRWAVLARMWGPDLASSVLRRSSSDR